MADNFETFDFGSNVFYVNWYVEMKIRDLTENNANTLPVTNLLFAT